MTRDWREWHQQYEQSGSALQRRLAAVQRGIRAALGARPPGKIRVISMCAGDGRDLLGVLADHPRAGDVVGRLVELDPALAAAARRAAPPEIEVSCGDASVSDAYAGAVPADLLLVCGVLGNMSDADVERTVRALSSLCSRGATVIWTRHRRPPDLTVSIRRWFGESGFDELEFVAPADSLYSVGMHRLAGAPRPWSRGERWFTFVANAEPNT